MRANTRIKVIIFDLFLYLSFLLTVANTEAQHRIQRWSFPRLLMILVPMLMFVTHF